jgi:hypothetical protein
MRTLLLACLLCAAAPVQAEEVHRVSGLTFTSPTEVEVTRHTLAPAVDSVAVTLGEEGLVFVQYTGTKLPSEARALKIHLEELEIRLLKTSVEGSLQVKKEKILLLGRSKTGRRLTYAKHYAGGERQYVSKLGVRRVGRVTLVVLWTAPVSEDEAYFSPALLESLKLSGSNP